MSNSKLTVLRSYLVSKSPSDQVSDIRVLRAYAVSKAPSDQVSDLRVVRVYAVSTPIAQKDLVQLTATDRPEYAVVNDTPFVKFEPGTNNKKLMFFFVEAKEHRVIALRPNLLDFFEATQMITDLSQIEVPHFNQLMVTPKNLTSNEVANIKNDMLARATGTGVDLEFASTVTLPIVNPGAETGDMTGWTTSEFAVSTGGSGETPGAYEGTYYFYAGDNLAAGSAYQDVDISGEASGIDAGGVSVEVSWQQSHFAKDDVGNIKLEFRDGVGTLLGSAPGPGMVAFPGGWRRRTTGPVTVPVNTRSVRMIMEAQRFAGSENNAYFDAIAGALVIPAPNSVPGGLQDPLIPGVTVSTGVGGLSHPLKQVSGENASWQQHTVDLSRYAGKDVRLVFEYEMTASEHTADLQLDAIDLDGTFYSFETDAEGFETSGYGESYHAVVFWLSVPSSEDRGLWCRNSGGTPSSGTGLSSAADGSYYIYAETSSPGDVAGWKFWLRSPVVTLGQTPTLSFYEARSGESVGLLSVRVDVLENYTPPQSVSARYWRMVPRSGSNGSYWGLAELDLQDASGNTLTGSGTVIVGAERSGFEAVNAFDGDPSTFWSAPTGASDLWLAYDFGSGNDVTVEKVSLTSRNDSFYGQMVQDFRIDYSEDGVSWTYAWGATGVPQYNQGETKSFSQT